MSGSKYLQHAIDIAESLIAKAEYNEHGMYWKSMSMDMQNDNAIIWNVSDSIYNGVAGITLFFVELYKSVPEKKYLKVIEQSAAWLIENDKNNPTHYYSLYSGRLGSAYCLSKIYTLTKNQIYKKASVEIALKADVFLKGENLKYDLLVGPPGCIIGLLHIYEATKENKILEVLDLYVATVLDNLYSSEAGIYWNRGKDYIHGLCGFSHGAAGMAYIFLELGHYFNNDSFLWLAEQIFKYENSYYDAKNSNWPDYRKSIYKEGDYKDFIKKYEEKQFDFFTKGGDMNAWCHGAAGIGLSRARAIECLHDEQYKTDLQNAIYKVIQSNIEPNQKIRELYGLCHGACGNAEIFVDAFEILKDNKLKKYAEQIADNAIVEEKKYGGYLSGYSTSNEQNDTSLFMGNAGIAYFMLRMNDSTKTESVLAPKLKSIFTGDVKKYTSITISPSQLKRQIIKKHFLRTINLIEENFSSTLNSFFENTISSQKSLQHDFFQFINAVTFYKQYPIIEEIFSLEWEKYLATESIKSDVLNYVQALYSIEKFEEYQNLATQDFLNLKLKFIDEAKIITTHFNWQEYISIDIQSPLPENELYVLLLPFFSGTIELQISDLLAALLTSFTEANKVEMVLNEVVDNFKDEPDDVQSQIKNAVIQNIMYGIQKGMLIPE